MNTKTLIAAATGTISEGLDRQLRDLGSWAVAGHIVEYWGLVDEKAEVVHANRLEYRMLCKELWEMDNEEIWSRS